MVPAAEPARDRDRGRRPRAPRPPVGDEARPTDRATRELEFWERYAPVPTPLPAPAPAELTEPPAEPTQPFPEDDDNGPEAEGMTTLYVNVGRRDGVRAAELARIVRERTGLGDTDIGKVRVRQRHTFVGVRTDRLEHAISTLTGTPWGDRTISAEPAKAGRA